MQPKKKTVKKSGVSSVKKTLQKKTSSSPKKPPSSPKQLSDEALKSAVNRLRLEKEYKQLTAKEKLVIKALIEGQGQTLRATAQGLNISENTVRNHLTSIYAKLGVANRLELFVFAQRFMANV